MCFCKTKYKQKRERNNWFNEVHGYTKAPGKDPVLVNRYYMFNLPVMTVAIISGSIIIFNIRMYTSPAKPGIYNIVHYYCCAFLVYFMYA